MGRTDDCAAGDVRGVVSGEAYRAMYGVAYSRARGALEGVVAEEELKPFAKAAGAGAESAEIVKFANALSGVFALPRFGVECMAVF